MGELPYVAVVLSIQCVGIGGAGLQIRVFSHGRIEKPGNEAGKDGNIGATSTTKPTTSRLREQQDHKKRRKQGSEKGRK